MLLRNEPGFSRRSLAALLRSGESEAPLSLSAGPVILRGNLHPAALVLRGSVNVDFLFIPPSDQISPGSREKSPIQARLLQEQLFVASQSEFARSINNRDLQNLRALPY